MENQRQDNNNPSVTDNRVKRVIIAVVGLIVTCNAYYSTDVSGITAILIGAAASSTLFLLKAIVDPAPFDGDYFPFEENPFDDAYSRP